MTEFRFAAIFDLHYCLDRARAMPAACADTDNKPGYMWMRRNLLPALVQELKQHSPELVICTGDISEGGLSGDASETQDLLRGELREVFELFAGAELPLLNALGTHEPAELYPEIAWPHLARVLGGELDRNYYVHDTEAAQFVVLDYLRLAPGSEQAAWLRDACLSAPAQKPLFLVAHAPMTLIARPFFSHTPMQTVLDEVFKERVPTAFLCGHTHNQAFSWHRKGTGGLVQIKGSSVGFPAAPVEPLTQRHVLLHPNGDVVYWGVPEDQCPGYWIFDVTEEGVLAGWYGIGRGLLGQAQLGLDGRAPAILKRPPFAPSPLCIADLPMIREASLEVYMSGDKAGDFAFELNGVPLGRMSSNECFAARRSVPLSRPALRSLVGENTLCVMPGASDAWLLGSARIAAMTYDGRRLYSEIPDALLVAGRYAEQAQDDARFIAVDARAPVVTRLTVRRACRAH